MQPKKRVRIVTTESELKDSSHTNTEPSHSQALLASILKKAPFRGDHAAYRSSTPQRKRFFKQVKTTESLADSSLSQSTEFSKLPPLSELLGAYPKNLDPGVHQVIVKLVKYAHQLEEILSQRNRELQRLEQINIMHIYAEQKRDDTISQLVKELTQLREKTALQQQEQQVSSLREGVRDLSLGDKIKRLQLETSPGRSVSPKRPLSSVGSYDSSKLNRSSSASKASTIIRTNSGLMKNKSAHAHQGKSWDRKSLLMNMIVQERTQGLESVLKPDERESDTVFQENELRGFLNELIESEIPFIQKMRTYNDSMLIHVFDGILFVLRENTEMFEMIKKLKRILKAAHQMTTSLVFTEAMEKICDETCDVLGCDRASVFLLDTDKGELWSRAAKDSETIRLPWNKGIVGAVTTTGQSVNILNAYQDNRFNKEVDFKTNYKTNTILCVPIMDEYQQVVGICQAINKKGGYFTKNDEGFLCILANIAGTVLRNSITFDQEKIFHHTIRSVLNSGIHINSLGDMSDIIPVSEKRLISIMGTSSAKILIADRKKGVFLHFKPNQLTKEYPIHSGLAGLILASGKFDVISNAYYHSNYNGLIDIETTLPLVVWPIKDPNDETEVIGIIEAVNVKGVEGMSAVHKPKLSPYDLETIDLFSKQLCRAVKNNTSNKNLNFSIFAT